MRRSLTLLATVAILIGLVAAPAAADKPVEYTLDLYFDADNPGLPLNDPCTGESMEFYDIVLVIREHQGHKDGVVGIAKGYGVTGSGYVLSGSPDHLRIKGDPDDGGFVVTGFNDSWRNPDTGAKMHMQSVFIMKDGVVQVDKFRTWCVGGPTVDPLP
jgi:hypothetical protein